MQFYREVVSDAPLRMVAAAVRRTWPQPRYWVGFVLIGRQIPCQSLHVRTADGGARLTEPSQPAVMSLAAARTNDSWSTANCLHPSYGRSAYFLPWNVSIAPGSSHSSRCPSSPARPAGDHFLRNLGTDHDRDMRADILDIECIIAGPCPFGVVSSVNRIGRCNTYSILDVDRVA